MTGPAAWLPCEQYAATGQTRRAPPHRGTVPSVSRTSTYERWRDTLFVRWNDALGERFFNPAAAGSQVWLTATPGLLDQVGATLGSDAPGLTGALLAGPPWDPAGGQLCRNALFAKDSWRARRHPPPPYPLYLGYLCLFAAAGVTGDGVVRANAYYPRLAAFAGLREPGTPPLFHRMAELWDDLQRWSGVDRGGALGSFVATGVGRHRHIGLPLAQNLITVAERRALTGAFAASGLVEPGDQDPDRLSGALLATAAPALSRIRGLLGERAGRDRELLLDLLTEAFASWQRDHAAPAPRPVPASPAPRGGLPTPRPAELPRRGRVALGARLDRAVGEIAVFLRLLLEPFSPYPPQLRTPAGAVVTCDEQAGGWSSPLAAPDGRELDARAAGDWLTPAVFVDDGLGFRTFLPAGRLRVLEPGYLHGLPHLLETHELDAGQQPVLLSHDSCWAAVREWGAGAAGFTEMRASGLPGGWRLASVARCPDPRPLRPLLPWLPAPAAPHVVFDGGLRAGQGERNTYLDFARPAVRLVGGTGAEHLTVAGLHLPADSDGRCALPPAVGLGRHTVRATLGGLVTAAATLCLDPGPGFARGAAPPPAGRPASTGRRDLLLAPGLWEQHLARNGRAQNFTLLTRTGKALRWGSTSSTPEAAKDAVWAVPEGPSPRAAYVGSGEPSKDGPLTYGAEAAWVALLAGRGAPARTVTPPADPGLAELWRYYTDAARDHH